MKVMGMHKVNLEKNGKFVLLRIIFMVLFSWLSKIFSFPYFPYERKETQSAQLKSVQTSITTITTINDGSRSATSTLSPSADTINAFLVFGVSETRGDIVYFESKVKVSDFIDENCI